MVWHKKNMEEVGAEGERKQTSKEGASWEKNVKAEPTIWLTGCNYIWLSEA